MSKSKIALIAVHAFASVLLAAAVPAALAQSDQTGRINAQAIYQCTKGKSIRRCRSRGRDTSETCDRELGPLKPSPTDVRIDLK